MGFLSSILPLAATALGTAVAGPVGGAIGGSLGGMITKNASTIGTGIGGAVGGYLDDKDNRQNATNARNIANEQYNSTFAQQQALGEQANAQRIAAAQKQMDFQERMSNTSHQREVKDLYAAGLNPILSSKYGGSSTPGGALAQIADTATPAASSAAARARQTLEMNQMAAQTNMLLASARKTEQETRTSQLENTLLEDRRGQITATTSNLRTSRNKIIADIGAVIQNTTNAAEKQKLQQLEQRIKRLSLADLRNKSVVAEAIGPYGQFLVTNASPGYQKILASLWALSQGKPLPSNPAQTFPAPDRKLENWKTQNARIKENSRRRRAYDNP